MLQLSDLADKIAPHLIGISTPFGGALAKNYIGADLSTDDSKDSVPTGDDLDKVKNDVKGELDKANQQIASLKNEMENVGFKVMSHIPDLTNGTDLDTSTVKDPRTSISTYLLQQKNGTSDAYIDLTTPITQTAPLTFSDNPSPYQIQIQLEVHDYPNGAVPWYYFHLMPYIKITAIRVKLNDTITNSYTQGGNDISGNISEGMTVPFNSSIAHIGQWYPQTFLSTPKASIVSPPARVDYTDPRDGVNYNDTPATLVIIPYGDWDAKNNNGSWAITQGSTPGGLYVAVYKGTCICYDIRVTPDPTSTGTWTKRYGKYYNAGFSLSTYGLKADYIGPAGMETIINR